MSTINERFREAREALNLSQEEFAQKAHRTRSEIKNIEYGKTTPKDPVIWSVCEAHGIDEVWLRTGEGQPFSDTPDEDEIVAALSQAMGGNPSTAKMRLIRAIAKMPEAYFPAIEQMITALAAELSPPPKN